MEKINIAELLKDCPQGMELDCTMFEGIEFDGIVDAYFPIRCRVKHPDGGYNVYNFTEYGCWATNDFAKCVIFPKGKTTWDGFVPLCKFKDGDIVYIKTNGYTHNELIIIFKEIKNDHIHKHVCFAYQVLYTDLNAVCHLVDVEIMRLATEEEKQKLFDAIKSNGYKWNDDTKTLEKLTEPKFRVGDEIEYKYPTTDTSTLKIIKVEYDKNRYVVCDKPNNYTFLSFFAQDNFNFIRKTKFDITTLVPFESRVLVRDANYGIWRVSFWGCLINTENGFNYDTIRGFYKQCVPYEQNEHLLGKTDDCDEYYKTWE